MARLIKSHSPEFSSTCCGIPCIIRVDSFISVPPDPTTWASDLDFHGYTELEYSVLDRHGYPAAWLEKKITKQEHDRIWDAVCDYMADG